MNKKQTGTIWALALALGLMSQVHAQGSNPVVSDGNDDTAAGSAALSYLFNGTYNPTTGANTAVGAGASIFRRAPTMQPLERSRFRVITIRAATGAVEIPRWAITRLAVCKR